MGRLAEVSTEDYGNIVGSVQDPDGNPVRSFTIKIALAGQDELFEYAFEDESGRFQLGQVMPGQCRVHVIADGFLEALAPVEVLPADTTRNVDFRLRRPGALRVEVREAGSDAPVEGAWIEAGHTEAEHRYTTVRHRTTGATDADGVATLAPLLPGEHFLFVRHEEMLNHGHSPGPIVAEGETRTVRVELQRGGSIRVEVPSAYGSFLGAHIYKKGGELGGNPWIPSEKGRAVVATSIPTGATVVIALALKRDGGREQVTILRGVTNVAEGEVATVDLEPIDRGDVRLHGRVTIGGEPMTHGTVEFTPRGGDLDGDEGESVPALFRHHTRSVESDGSYEVKAAFAGKVEIRVSSGSGRRQSLSPVIPKNTDSISSYPAAGSRDASLESRTAAPSRARASACSGKPSGPSAKR